MKICVTQKPHTQEECLYCDGGRCHFDGNTCIPADCERLEELFVSTDGNVDEEDIV